MVGAREAPALSALHPERSAVRALLHRARGEPVPLHRPAQHHHLAGGRCAGVATLHAVWRDPDPPNHSGLHRLFLLRVLGSDGYVPLGVSDSYAATCSRMVVTNALTNIFEGPFCLGIDAANAILKGGSTVSSLIC